LKPPPPPQNIHARVKGNGVGGAVPWYSKLNFL